MKKPKKKKRMKERTKKNGFRQESLVQFFTKDILQSLLTSFTALKIHVTSVFSFKNIYYYIIFMLF